jgi:hypothetical protein
MWRKRDEVRSGYAQAVQAAARTADELGWVPTAVLWELVDRWKLRHREICRLSVVLGLFLVLSLIVNLIQWSTR